MLRLCLCRAPGGGQAAGLREAMIMQLCIRPATVVAHGVQCVCILGAQEVGWGFSPPAGGGMQSRWHDADIVGCLELHWVPGAQATWLCCIPVGQLQPS